MLTVAAWLACFVVSLFLSTNLVRRLFLSKSRATQMIDIFSRSFLRQFYPSTILFLSLSLSHTHTHTHTACINNCIATLCNSSGSSYSAPLCSLLFRTVSFLSVFVANYYTCKERMLTYMEYQACTYVLPFTINGQ